MSRRFSKIALVLVLVFTFFALAGASPAFAESGSITGLVWDDWGTEMSGVTVELYDGAVLASSTVTGTMGDYAFDVPFGTYTVRFDPAAYNALHLSAFIEQWHADAPDQAAATPVTIDAGNPSAGVYCQMDQLRTIWGEVATWADFSVKLEGVTVEIYDGSTLVTSTVTNAQGQYYAHVPSGIYTVYFSPEPLNTATGSDYIPLWCWQEPTQATAYAVGVDHMNSAVYAGTYLRQYGTLAGYVTSSLDGTALAGIEVTASHSAESIVVTTTTDASGYYEFDDLIGGTYFIEFDATAYNEAHPDKPYYYGEPSSGIPMSPWVEYGGFADGSVALDGLRISGEVFSFDNGVWCENTRVELWDGNGLVESTTTPPGGHFEFLPRPGSYWIHYDPSGWNADNPGDNPLAPRWCNGGLTTETILPTVLDSSTRDVVCDGQLTVKLLSLLAYNSYVGPIEGATFRLYDEAGIEVTSTVTDADGRASFNPVPDGMLRIRLDLGLYNLANGTHLADQWLDGESDFESADPIEVPYYHVQQFDFYVVPPTKIQGYVTGPGDVAAPDVEVMAQDYYTGAVVATASTDAGGHYSFWVDPNNEYAVYFRAGPHNALHVPALRSGFWSEMGLREWWEAQSIDANPNDVIDASVTLPEGATIRGRVVDKTGAPLRDVGIRAHLVPLPEVTEQDLLEQIAGAPFQATTEADGTFEIDFVGEYSHLLDYVAGAKVWFVPTANSGYLAEYYDDAPDESAAETVPVTLGVASSADATLTLGSTMSGIVHRADGEPLANIAVHVKRVGDPGWGYRATTITDGTYEAIGLVPGDYLVKFDPTQVNGDPEMPLFYETAYWDAESTEASADILPIPAETNLAAIDATLTEAVGSISGYVHDQLGNPVPSVDVRVSRIDTVEGEGASWTEWVEQPTGATTDDTGYYHFDRVHAGELRVRFVSPTPDMASEWYDNQHLESLADTIPLATGGNLASIDATLEAVGHVGGVLRDESSGELVRGATVRMWAQGVEGWQVVASGATDGSGAYSLVLESEGPVRLDFGGDPATVFETADHRWYLSETYEDQPDIASGDDIAAGLGMDVTVDASLTPAASIAGHVEYNLDAGDVWVDVLRDDGAGWEVVKSERVEGNGPASDLDSDEDGYPDWVDPWPFDPELPGPLGLDSDEDGIPDFLDPYPNDPGLPGWGDLDGDGIPDFLDSDRDGDGIPNDLDPEPDVADGTIAGDYSVEGLLPGSYKVRFRDASHFYITQYYDNVRTLSEGETLTVTAGEARLGIDATLAPGGTITGAVDPISYDYSPSDSNTSFVAVYRHVGAGWEYVDFARADMLGNFSLGGLETGSYAVIAYADHSGGFGYVPESWSNAAVPGFEWAQRASYSLPGWVTPLEVTEGAETIVPETIVLSDISGMDLVAPVSSIDAPIGWANHDVTLHISAVDAKGLPVGTYGAIGDGPLVATTTLPTITTDGETLVRFYSIDAFGNREDTRTATVRIDKSPPITIDDHLLSYAHTAFVRMYGTDTASGPDETRFVFDGGPVTIGNAVVTSETGPHSLSYWSTDRAGNSESTKTVIFNVGGETNPPETTATAPVGWAKAPVEVALTADDDFSGIDATWYSTDGGFPRTLYMTPFSIAEDGVHIVKFRSIDGQGNAEAVKWIEVWVDGTPPSTTATLQAKTGEATVTLTASDAHSGAAGTDWSLNGTPGSGGAVHAVGAGHYTLDYSSIDAVGNRETTKTLTFDVYDDTTPPETNATAPSGWVLPPAHVTLAAADDLSGVAGTYYSTDGSYPSLPYAGAFAVSANGKHTVRFRSVDACGNEESPGSVEVWVDGEAPSTSAIVERSYGRAKITLAVSDVGSGVSQTHWAVDGVPGTGSAIELTALGVHTIEYRSVDLLGNEETTKTLSLTLAADTTPPVTTAMAPTGWVKPSAVVTLTATDSDTGVDAIYYSTDGLSPRFRYFDPLEFAADGVTTLRYRAVDRQGNAEPIRSLTVRVDGTPPVTTSAVELATSAATVTLSAVDPHSSVASTEWRLDGGPATTGLTVAIGEPGVHALQYRSTDVAGNVEEWRAREVVIAQGTTLDISASATSTVYPGTVQLTAHLLGEGGAGIAGQSVAVQTSPDGITWTTVATPFSADGNFALSVVPAAFSYYRADFAGTAQHASARSGVVSVAVNPTLSTPKTPSPVKAGGTFTVTTRLRPKHASGRSSVIFKFYRRQSGKWVWKKNVRGTNSSYNSTTTKVAAKTSLKSRGTWRVVAYHPADTHLPFTSAPRQFTVK